MYRRSFLSGLLAVPFMRKRKAKAKRLRCYDWELVQSSGGNHWLVRQTSYTEFDGVPWTAKATYTTHK